jgi:hypothetical protein
VNELQDSKRLRAEFVSLLLSIGIVLFVSVAQYAVAQQSDDANQKPAAAQIQNEGQAAEPAPPNTDQQAAKSERRLSMNWDTTLKFTAMFRTASRNSKLINPTAKDLSAINLDDGDRNFHGGLVSDRGDVLSEMDVKYGEFGVRASMAGWLDPKYNERTANNSPSTFNGLLNNYQHFGQDAQYLQFRAAELLDLFGFGKFNIGSSTLSVRGGQYSLLWGESLFFGNNGIAGAQSPIDVIKLLSVPSTQFKELIRPVPQVSFLLQVNPRFAIGAYYQLGWEKLRLPAAGSYFSATDVLEGGDRILYPAPVPPGTPYPWLKRVADFLPKNDGQFGIELKIRPGAGLDLGFYGLQYHDKGPDGTYLNPGNGFNPETGQIGTYNWAYAQNIKMYGMSATKTIGIVNWAAEVSGRTNTPLVSDPALVGAAVGGIVGDNHQHPLYAVGDSLHANLSALAAFGPSFISRESVLLAEVAFNRMLAITLDPFNGGVHLLDPGVTKNAVGMRGTYEPTYRQVRPGLDLSIPIGLSYFPEGKSAVVSNFGPNHGGDMSFGVAAAYRDAWRMQIAYTRFYGAAAPLLKNGDTNFTFEQALSDRNNISLAIYHTFGVKAGGQK